MYSYQVCDKKIVKHSSYSFMIKLKKFLVHTVPGDHQLELEVMYVT